MTIQAYHSCRTSGGWHYIFKNAPFLSEPNSRQWLTQGYYFWTDSDHFAHKWGGNSLKNDYAVIKCSIDIERHLLLDLVGSVEDQLFFQSMLKRFHKKLKKANPNAKEPTVHAILSFYRRKAGNNPDLFPYQAIKAQDNYSENKLSFIDAGRNEQLSLVTRQQLCLFESASHCIKNKEVIYPEQFIEESRLLAKKER